MARDRPAPYGNGDGFLFLTVARGPVPRECPRAPVTVVRDRLIPNSQHRLETNMPELQTILTYRGDEG